jgi:hypothetical protein
MEGSLRSCFGRSIDSRLSMNVASFALERIMVFKPFPQENCEPSCFRRDG